MGASLRARAAELARREGITEEAARSRLRRQEGYKPTPEQKARYERNRNERRRRKREKPMNDYLDGKITAGKPNHIHRMLARMAHAV